ncbi:hypothetical protein [Sorangium sp. So ce1000]|uniref:hypothetical protein n=1 Tax=Sorangium sp. So ce1000 TaxID=3133325 RepID=UPI003F61EF6F
MATPWRNCGRHGERWENEWRTGSFSLSAPAAAQDIAAAEALFERGLTDMQAGRYETGCKALAESERIDPQPGTLFTLASCEAQWGRIATAVARFKDYLARFEQMTPVEQARQGERPKLARQERDRLLPQVPRLALSLPAGASAGTTAAVLCWTEPRHTGPAAGARRRVRSRARAAVDSAGRVAKEEI